MPEPVDVDQLRQHPRRPDCGAHVHCLLPAGHGGDHRHDDTRCWPITRCRPITWPAEPGEDRP